MLKNGLTYFKIPPILPALTVKRSELGQEVLKPYWKLTKQSNVINKPIILKLFALSCIMLKKSQAHFKNLAVLTQEDF